MRTWIGSAAAKTAGAYLIAGMSLIAMTRFGGGVACLWIATAVLIAGLTVSPRRRWPGIVAACACSSLIGTVTVGVGMMAAAPLAFLNMSEGLIAALLLARFRLRSDSLDSLERLARMVLAVGILAPLATAPLAAWVVMLATGTSFADNLLFWFVGHGLGNVTAVPIFTMIASGGVGRWVRGASRERRFEAVALLALVGSVTGAVFAQRSFPALFLPVLPAIVATFRIGRLGATASVVIIATVGGYFSVSGSGPMRLIDGDAATRAQFFLFYLAVTVLTVLPVAAELRHRRAVFDRLRESEARYRLLADHSSDIVLNLDLDGIIRYASPSIAQLGGYTPEAVIGSSAVELVLPEDREAVTRAHRRAVGDPERTMTVEYRATTAAGEVRWFEMHTRGVRDEGGVVTGAVAAIRDVDRRKAIEGELSLAAATDPLTGLANRRIFDAVLDRLVEQCKAGCVAIFDLDHFKQINDHWGHDAGDRVLVAVAECARGALRDGDLVARLGGEEFGVLLPGADRDQARAVCERLRRIIGDQRLSVAGTGIRVTASMGLAAIVPGVTRLTVMRAADAALYAAKAGGRDRLNLAA
ncbi:MAG TPA: diguanylate cyclase [Sphingomonas sp.]|jgi:diguanylate cyclase (GGDEF)-like protein/PAS domain S-box-containing protein|uniref:sensor domain-containing diguanylate cyclase n=1 Tax=Sphingomonas sp. TaxID=28214 RepID=UPI002EDB6A08